MHIMKYYSTIITSEFKKKWNGLLTHATACQHGRISKELCQVKKIHTKRAYITWFLFQRWSLMFLTFFISKYSIHIIQGVNNPFYIKPSFISSRFSVTHTLLTTTPWVVIVLILSFPILVHWYSKIIITRWPTLATANSQFW